LPFIPFDYIAGQISERLPEIAFAAGLRAIA
jgi:hypothetical protein